MFVPKTKTAIDEISTSAKIVTGICVITGAIISLVGVQHLIEKNGFAIRRLLAQVCAKNEADDDDIGPDDDSYSGFLHRRG